MILPTIASLVFGLAAAAPALRRTPPSAASPAPGNVLMPSHVTDISVSHVAFASVVPFKTTTSLLLSTFDAMPFFGKDHVMAYTSAGSVLSGANAPKPDMVDGDVTWPNDISQAPASVFGSEGVLISGGFLVPGKTNGGIWFAPHVDGKLGSIVNLFQDKDYFYHRTVMYDVDRDGHLDILSCRAIKPMFGAATGDLVMLKPKDSANPTGKWDMTVIAKGCDTYFRIQDIDGDGRDEIISAEFWGEKLTVIQSSHPDNRFDKAEFLEHTTIDDTLGPMFDVELVDLNGDGKLDLLATNHDGKGEGAVYAYQIPSDIKNGPWIRRALSPKFPVLVFGIGQASPGTAQTFHPIIPKKGARFTKPSIVVSGDGSKSAYILTPESQDRSNWRYSLTALHDCKGTAGGIAVGDVNKDGRSEIYIPCYDTSILSVYTY